MPVTKVEAECRQCHRQFLVRAVVVRRGGGKFCSRPCTARATFTGRKLSAEVIERKRIRMAGAKLPESALAAAAAVNRVRVQSEEEKEKRRMTLRASMADPVRGAEIRERRASLRRGWIHSEETKAAIRAAHRTPEARAAAADRGKAWRASMTPEQRKAHYSKIVRNSKHNTRLERTVAGELRQMKVEFIRQYYIDPYSADFFLPEYNLVIECDGQFWHSSEKAKARDAKRDAYMRGLGYKVLRLPENIIRSVCGPCEAIRGAL